MSIRYRVLAFDPASPESRLLYEFMHIMMLNSHMPRTDEDDRRLVELQDLWQEGGEVTDKIAVADDAFSAPRYALTQEAISLPQVVYDLALRIVKAYQPPSHAVRHKLKLIEFLENAETLLGVAESA